MIDDRAFLTDASQWPGDDIKFCCLKRRTENNRDYEHGFLLFGCGFTVFLGYVFDGGDGPMIEYESVDELLEAGWLVD